MSRLRFPYATQAIRITRRASRRCSTSATPFAQDASQMRTGNAPRDPVPHPSGKCLERASNSTEARSGWPCGEARGGIQPAGASRDMHAPAHAMALGPTGPTIERHHW